MNESLSDVLVRFYTLATIYIGSMLVGFGAIIALVVSNFNKKISARTAWKVLGICAVLWLFSGASIPCGHTPQSKVTDYYRSGTSQLQVFHFEEALGYFYMFDQYKNHVPKGSLDRAVSNPLTNKTDIESIIEALDGGTMTVDSVNTNITSGNPIVVNYLFGYSYGNVVMVNVFPDGSVMVAASYWENTKPDHEAYGGMEFPDSPIVSPENYGVKFYQFECEDCLAEILDTVVNDEYFRNRDIPDVGPSENWVPISANYIEYYNISRNGEQMNGFHEGEPPWTALREKAWEIHDTAVDSGTEVSKYHYLEEMESKQETYGFNSATDWAFTSFFFNGLEPENEYQLIHGINDE